MIVGEVVATSGDTAGVGDGIDERRGVA
jgi:hypothetical protein